MHPAAAFRRKDAPALLAHLRRHPFVTLAAAPEGRLLIANAPVVVVDGAAGLALEFHLSRNNALAAHVAGGFWAVAVSLGPDAYVSPDWYEGADQVPTWNYVAVEAEGAVAALSDLELATHIDALSAQEEARLAPKPPWTRAKMTPGRVEAMMRGIVGARMAVERLEGTFKLSQNKGGADRAGVARALGEHPVVGLMREG